MVIIMSEQLDLTLKKLTGKIKQRKNIKLKPKTKSKYQKLLTKLTTNN